MNLNLADHSTLTLFLATVVALLSAGRTARLLIHDSLPPMVWLRTKIVSKYKDDSEWVTLWDCPFCMIPWLMIPMIAWAEISDLNQWWWLANIWWAASWLGAIVFVYDQPE